MINSQAKLTGLKVNEPKTLTPPAQLLNNNNLPAGNYQVELLPAQNKQNDKSALGENDNISKMVNLASSGIAGGIAASNTARNVGIIGESMRGMQVQQSMMAMQARMMGGGGYNSYMSGGYNNYSSGSYNSYDPTYANNYSSPEYYRGNYGRAEALYGRRYGGIEDYSSNPQLGMRPTSPEMQMAYRNIANGAISGLKYGTLIGGAVSSVVNAYNVVSGKSTGKEAVGNVAADAVTAGVSGGTGAVAGGFAALGLGMVGVGGVPGLVLAAGAGVVGAVASQLFLQKSGIYDSIKEKVMNMVGGKK